MKKLVLFAGIIFAATFAGAFWGANNWENQGDVQVSTVATRNNIVQPTAVLFDISPRGNRDCITKLSFSGDAFPAAGATITLISSSSTTASGMGSGTTFYALSWTTGPVTDYWDFQNPICSPDTGTTTYITVSTGNYKVNAIGFIRNK